MYYLWFLHKCFPVMEKFGPFVGSERGGGGGGGARGCRRGAAVPVRPRRDAGTGWPPSRRSGHRRRRRCAETPRRCTAAQPDVDICIALDGLTEGEVEGERGRGGENFPLNYFFWPRAPVFTDCESFPQPPLRLAPPPLY